MEITWRWCGDQTNVFEANSIELSPDPRDDPISVRVRPSSIERDCDRRTTSTGGKASVNVHAKSRLTLAASADTPVRNQRPGGSLPGPDAGHPLQGAGIRGGSFMIRKIRGMISAAGDTSDRVGAGSTRTWNYVRRSGSTQKEVWVASPEPAVGVFTTAGTCQGRLRRH